MLTEKWEENVKRVLALVETWSEPRRSLINEMLAGKIGEQFFTAPASSREQFHNAFTGGLLDHSLNVVKNAESIANGLGLFKGVPEFQRLQFAALFHDFGKAGDGEEPYYIATSEDWKRRKGELYEPNPKCKFLTTAERGLFLFQKLRIPLEHDEYMSIRLNDGQYVRENEPYKLKEPQMALVVHWADRQSLEQEKK